MEAKLFLHSRSNSLSSMWVGRKLTHIHPQCFSSSFSPKVFAVLTTSPNITATSTSVHNDNWFNRIAINYLSQTVQVTTGLKNEKMGYQSLVEAAAMVSQNFNTKKQQELVMKALDKAFPQAIMSMIRTLLPQSKFTRELFALFTIFFFAWLVGPCEVKESEVKGRMEKNVVHIKKCRFLEESSCVGMCLNLCKMPSQKFIKDSLGMPVNMVPNFEDMSCDMIFGQEPMAASDDPAFKQPCYKTLCKSKQKHTSDCFS